MNFLVGINNEGIRDHEVWFLVPSFFYLISNSSCFSFEDRVLKLTLVKLAKQI